MGGDPCNGNELGWSTIRAKLQSMGERISEKELMHCMQVRQDRHDCANYVKRVMQVIGRDKFALHIHRNCASIYSVRPGVHSAGMDTDGVMDVSWITEDSAGSFDTRRTSPRSCQTVLHIYFHFNDKGG